MRGDRSIAALVAGALVLGIAVAPSTAEAWWRGGVGVGIGFGFAPAPFYPGPFYSAPVYVPPPVYYAPPVYAPPVYAPPVYAPPPVYYSQPEAAPAPSAGTAQNANGTNCYAGPYVCPLEQVSPAGSDCSCPGNSGRVYGRVG